MRTDAVYKVYQETYCLSIATALTVHCPSACWTTLVRQNGVRLYRDTAHGLTWLNWQTPHVKTEPTWLKRLQLRITWGCVPCGDGWRNSISQTAIKPNFLEGASMELANREGTHLGETVGGKDLGFIKGGRYVWIECPTCKETRWTQSRPGQPNKQRFCKPCLIEYNKNRFQIKSKR